MDIDQDVLSTILATMKREIAMLERDIRFLEEEDKMAKATFDQANKQLTEIRLTQLKYIQQKERLQTAVDVLQGLIGVE